MSVFDFIIRFKSDGVDQVANTVKGKMASAMGDLKTAAAGYLSVQFAREQINATKDYALRIKDLSEQFDISTDRLQEMEYAAKMSGMSIEDIIQSFSKFKLAREAALSGKAGNSDQKNFDMLGLSSAKLGSMTPEEAWNAAGRAMAKMSDNANTARMSVDLFGRSGIRFANALKGGFMEAADSAKNLGIVIGEDLIEQMDLLDKRFNLLLIRLRRGIASSLSGIMWIVDKIQQAGGGWGQAFWQLVNNFQKGSISGEKDTGAKLLADAKPSIWEAFQEGVQNVENEQQNDELRVMREMTELARRRKRRSSGLNNTNAASDAANSNAVIGAGSPAMISDALTRIGLFRGGAGPSPVAIMQQQLGRLDRVIQKLDTLNYNLTDPDK